MGGQSQQAHTRTDTRQCTLKSSQLAAFALDQPVNDGVREVGHDGVQVTALLPLTEHIHAGLAGGKGGVRRFRCVATVGAAARCCCRLLQAGTSAPLRLLFRNSSEVPGARGRLPAGQGARVTSRLWRYGQTTYCGGWHGTNEEIAMRVDALECRFLLVGYTVRQLYRTCSVWRHNTFLPPPWPAQSLQRYSIV